MPELNNFMINNFKIFEGEHWFSFKDLNILTGANNSGKSTLIKAISLFSEGIAKGDFPALNLISVGDFDSQVNNKSDSKSFSLGFQIYIADISTPFKVVYSFENGANGGFDEQKGKALFSGMEVIDKSQEVFFGIYKTDFFKADENNIDIASVEKYLVNSSNKKISELELPFKSPSDGNFPGVLFFKLNIMLLEKHISQITDEDFSLLIDHLHCIKSKQDFWYGECFDEETFGIINHDVSKIKFNDFLVDLELDRYGNIGDYDLRNSLFYDSDTKDEEKKYRDLINNSGYSEFIRKVFYPIFESINSGLKVFRQKSILHVDFQKFDKRLISAEPQFDYIQKVFRLNENQNFNEFIYESLCIFGIDGIIEIKSHLNSVFEINLITGMTETHNMLIEKQKEEQSTEYKIFFSETHQKVSIYEISRYKDNPKFNIVDLGKGTANIIALLLKVGSIIFSYQKEKNQKQKLPVYRGLKPTETIDKTVLIEEPEVFLHPDWQSKLADFFVYCLNLKESGIKLIIETHSVYLVQKLQLLIARQKIDSSKVNILYFNSGNEQEKFYKLNIRKDGILKENFGKGFYDEIASLTTEMLNEQCLN